MPHSSPNLLENETSVKSHFVQAGLKAHGIRLSLSGGLGCRTPETASGSSVG